MYKNTAPRVIRDRLPVGQCILAWLTVAIVFYGALFLLIHR
jgi:hypothetical protein